MLLSFPELYLRYSTPFQTTSNPLSELITAGIPVVSGHTELRERTPEQGEFLSGGGTDSCNCPLRENPKCRCMRVEHSPNEEEHSDYSHTAVLADQSSMGTPPLAVAKLAALPHTTLATVKQPHSISNFTISFRTGEHRGDN